jgi:hypothetical protein
MDTKTSPVSPKCQRGSSFVVGNMFVLVLVNLLAATPLFSPTSFGRAVRSLVYMPRGRTVVHHSSPFSMRWWILEVVNSIFSCHRVSPDLSAMASPILVMDPSDMARRVVESNLQVVWRGSQRVNLSVCVCMYVLYDLCDCLMRWNWEWRWVPFNSF